MNTHSSKLPDQALFAMYGLWTVLVFLQPVASWGSTYYVAQTGSDSSPGTLSQPFQSFARGVSVLQPGDTLYIREGIWTEQIRLVDKTGTPGNYITIAGYPGETVTIQYVDRIENGIGPISVRGKRGYFNFENLVLDGVNTTKKTGWQIRDGNHHFILRNLEIKNFKYNGLYIEATDIQVIDCKIHDAMPAPPPNGSAYYYGIYINRGSNILIQGNEIHHNSGGGIHIYPGPLSNVVIRGNKLHHNNYIDISNVEGIVVFQKSSTPIDGVEIYNNLIYRNGVNQPGSGRSGGIRVSNGVTGTKIWNNTIYGNKGWGINVQFGPGGYPRNTVVQNNIIFANTLGEITASGSGSVLSHNLTTDPKFQKTDAFDFRLQAHSAAIDSGTKLIQVNTDFRSLPRPIGATHDIGAYEYEASESVAPDAPRNLSVK